MYGFYPRKKYLSLYRFYLLLIMFSINEHTNLISSIVVRQFTNTARIPFHD